ncbi:hypothetical protein PM082_019403 [Marasmius tenuissimus]|nr:hypothetical protein PM082_019403 [Marasmius tenuissimus]
MVACDTVHQATLHYMVDLQQDTKSVGLRDSSSPLAPQSCNHPCQRRWMVLRSHQHYPATVGTDYFLEDRISEGNQQEARATVSSKTPGEDAQVIDRPTLEPARGHNHNVQTSPNRMA